MKNEKIKIFFLFIIVTGLIAYVPLRNYEQNGEKAIFSYFTNDAFYYLTVADNYAQKGVYSYDGVNPTNGFHPLWQFYLGNSFKFIPDKTSQLFFTFLSSIFFTAIGYFFIVLTLYKKTDNYFLSIIAMIPGLFSILFFPLLNGRYCSWAFINGMESCLSVFFFGIFIYLALGLRWFDKDSSLKKIILVVLLLLISFSRLDDTFLLVSFMFYYLLLNHRYKVKDNLPESSMMLSLIILIISIYLTYNYFFNGMIFPVSGMEKSGFAPGNFFHLANLFTGTSFNSMYGIHLYSRILPLFVTTSFGLYIFWKNRKSPITLTSVLALYLILKGLYNFFFVDLWGQGDWYFVLGVIIINFILSRRISNFSFIISKGKLISIIIIILLIFYSNGFIELNRFPNSKNYELFNSRDRINFELNKIDPKMKIIEMDDGIIAYSLGKPCLSGFGLNLDKNMYEAKKSGNLLNEAYKNGYRYLASLNYFKKPINEDDTVMTIRSFTREPFFAFKNENTAGFFFKKFLYDEATGLVIIELKKYSNLTPTLSINGEGGIKWGFSPSPFMERVGVRLLF